MRKKNAVIFVSYENWYRSSILLYGVKPDLIGWFLDIKERFECKKIYFFGNFTKYADEYSRIQVITEDIIDTHSNNKKNMSNVIMLDYIYQISQMVSPNTYIIFSGDGHFETVIQYLIQKRKKEVIIYGIRGSFNIQLKSVASEIIELPFSYDMRSLCIRAIIREIRYLELRNRITRKPFYSTVVNEISEQLDIQTKEIENILSEMMTLKFLFKEEMYLSERHEELLVLNKSRLRENGFLV